MDFKALLDNIDYWRNAPVWTPQTIEKATATWFNCLGDDHGGQTVQGPAAS